MGFRVVELQQQSDAWIAWRRNGIGASDAAVIMGVSPYATLEALWRQKVGQDDEPSANWAMEAGRGYKALIRRAYETEFNVAVFPECVEAADRAWCRASLDGLVIGQSVCLQARFVNKKDFGQVFRGYIPAHHYAHCQHILSILGDDYVCDYAAYNPNVTPTLVYLRVRPDGNYLRELRDRELAFVAAWNKRDLPALDRWGDLARVYQRARTMRDDALSWLRSVEAEIAEAFAQDVPAGASTFVNNGLRVSRTDPVDAIDYDGLLTYLKVDEAVIDRFRKRGEPGLAISVDAGVLGRRAAPVRVERLARPASAGRERAASERG